VQLLRRQWIITDGVGKKRVVEGEGVVGQQPLIMPGAYHEYVSGCDFPVPIGQMKGWYHMTRLSDGALLKVRIPTFVMAAPFVLN
jgi:ApaG protein